MVKLEKIQKNLELDMGHKKTNQSDSITKPKNTEILKTREKRIDKGKRRQR
jgi:hypothetical protein